jgi:hypothetical protein
MEEQREFRKWKIFVLEPSELALFRIHSVHDVRDDALSHACTCQSLFRDVQRIEGPDGEIISLPEIRQWYLDWFNVR